MGILNFTVGTYARSKGAGAATTRSSRIRTSDAYTTSTSASNVEDGSGDITCSVGEVFFCHADEDMWINFGGNAATVGDGHFIAAGTSFDCEVEEAGTVSVIDVA